MVISAAKQPAITLSGLRFSWPGQPPLLDIPSFSLAHGERLFLHGPSGSGKTTLLNLLAGVLEPQQGVLKVLGQEFNQISARQRDQVRADSLGFIFQVFNLVPYLSMVDNVLLPCRFSKQRERRACKQWGSSQQAAEGLLAALGLGDSKLQQRSVTELSVGQQQRVAAARALIGAPELIIADEPTSALDSEARGAFIDLLMEQVESTGSSLLFVSHDLSLASAFPQQRSLAQLNNGVSG